MKRKLWFVFTLVVLTCLLTATYAPVQAGRKDQWKRVPFTPPANSGVHAMESFNGSLYAAVEDYTLGLSVWRMEKDGAWKQVTENGFGNANLSNVMDMIPFHGKLYVSTGDYGWRTAGQLWRSADGKNWEAVTTDGFGQTGNMMTGKFAIFKDELYVDVASTEMGNVEIWRSASGAPGSWQPVVTAASFGNIYIGGATGFVEFKGALYATFDSDWSHNPPLWRTTDGTHWTVISDSALNDPLNISSGGMAVFKDYLYRGMCHCDFNVPESCTGQIYRSRDGLKWEAVISSFGDWHNLKVESLYAFQGKLYAGTWNADWQNWLYPPGTGVQIWATSNGVEWTQVNESGFGDPYNWATHLAVDVTEYKGDLYYGTLNDNGGQIWKLSK